MDHYTTRVLMRQAQGVHPPLPLKQTRSRLSADLVDAGGNIGNRNTAHVVALVGCQSPQVTSGFSRVAEASPLKQVCSQGKEVGSSCRPAPPLSPAKGTAVMSRKQPESSEPCSQTEGASTQQVALQREASDATLGALDVTRQALKEQRARKGADTERSPIGREQSASPAADWGGHTAMTSASLSPQSASPSCLTVSTQTQPREGPPLPLRPSCLHHEVSGHGRSSCNHGHSTARHPHLANSVSAPNFSSESPEWQTKPRPQLPPMPQSAKRLLFEGSRDISHLNPKPAAIQTACESPSALEHDMAQKAFSAYGPNSVAYKSSRKVREGPSFFSNTSPQQRLTAGSLAATIQRASHCTAALCYLTAPLRDALPCLLAVGLGSRALINHIGAPLAALELPEPIGNAHEWYMGLQSRIPSSRAEVILLGKYVDEIESSAAQALSGSSLSASSTELRNG